MIAPLDIEEYRRRLAERCRLAYLRGAEAGNVALTGRHMTDAELRQVIARKAAGQSLRPWPG